MPDTKRPSEGVRGIRVVLVGQDERFRGPARAALREVPGARVIGEATDGTAAMVICILADPDVVVVDALMSWHEGSDIVARIHEAQPTASIVASRESASRDGMVAAPLILSPGPALAAGPWGLLSTVVRYCGRPAVGRPEGV
jgi:AmiR/NasT family two-component response regulator